MCVDQTDGWQKWQVSAPLSKKEDKSLFLWVTVASEATITSTHISLTKTSHMRLTSRGSAKLPQAQ